MERDRAANALPLREDPEPPPITFGNPIALRACYWNAVVAALFSNLPWTAGLCFLWFPAAGFFSVASYFRRSGFSLTIPDGAKLGRMVGVIAFAMWMALTALSAMAVDGGFSTVMEELESELREAGDVETADKIAEAAETPSAMALGVLLAIVVMFALCVSLSALGGAVGAKILPKKELA